MKHELLNKSHFDMLVLSGDIDLHHSPTLRDSILASLKSGRPLLVDMQEVSYIDSSGIASLVEGFQTAKSANLHFGLLSISSPTMQVLTITRLDKIFSLYDDEESFIEILVP